MIEKLIETQHGKVRVKGKVGQAHLDVFEAICYSRIKKKDSDGRIHLMVDPWEVKKISDQFSGTTLQKIIDDLLQVIIEIIDPEKLAGKGHLIDQIDPTINPATGEKIVVEGKFGIRNLWTVKLGETFCRLIQKDVWVGYDPTPIVKLRHGISQAVVRHALTHKNTPCGGWKLDTLIKAVICEEVNSKTFQKYRERVREDAGAMFEAGILIENDRLLKLDSGSSDT